jgi:hypothetical protein
MTVARDSANNHKAAVRVVDQASESLDTSADNESWDIVAASRSPSFALGDAAAGHVAVAELVAWAEVEPCMDLEESTDIQLEVPNRDGHALTGTFLVVLLVEASHTFGRMLPPSSDPWHKPEQDAVEVDPVAVDSFVVVASAGLASSDTDNAPAFAAAVPVDIALAAFVA